MKPIYIFIFNIPTWINFVFTILINLNYFVFAQTSPITPETKPQFILTEDSIKFIISANKEATFFTTQTAPMTVLFPIELNENLCAISNYQKPSCQYKMNFKMNELTLRWTKHPDPKKINQTVLFEYTNTENQKITSTIQMDANRNADFFTNQLLSQLIKPDLHNDELECDSYDFLGNTLQSSKKILFYKSNNQISHLDSIKLNTSGSDTLLLIRSFTNEMMNQNEETGINENRALSQVENLIFLKNNNKFELQQIGNFFAPNILTFPNTIFIGTTSTLQIYRSESMSTCQMTFTHDSIPKFIQLVKQNDIELKNKPNIQPLKNFKNKFFNNFINAFRKEFQLDFITQGEYL